MAYISFDTHWDGLIGVAADVSWCGIPGMSCRTYADGASGESVALALRFNGVGMMVDSRTPVNLEL
jgi:hypothetical protein